MTVLATPTPAPAPSPVEPPAMRMRLGVCHVPVPAYGWTAPLPTAKSWQALRALGVTDVRMQFNLADVSPTPGSWDPSLFEERARDAHAAGLRINANIVTGVFDPTLIVAPPPAHHTAELRYELTVQLVTEFGDLIDSYGLGNEPGYGWWMTDDDVSKDGATDCIRATYFPQFIVPVERAIRSVKPQAIISGFEAESPAIQRRCMEAAKDSGVQIDVETVHPYGDVGGGDYATLEKFDRERHEARDGDGSTPWLIGEVDHQQFPGGKDRPATDEHLAKLTEFAQMVVTKYPDCDVVYFGSGGDSTEYFFTRELADPSGSVEMLKGVTWSTWTFGKPVVSEAGRKLADVFRAKIAAGKARHRAVKG